MKKLNKKILAVIIATLCVIGGISGALVYVFLVPVNANYQNLTITYYVSDKPTTIQSIDGNLLYSVQIRIDAHSLSPVVWRSDMNNALMVFQANFADGVYDNAGYYLNCTVKEGEPQFYDVTYTIQAPEALMNSEGDIFTEKGLVPSGYTYKPIMPQRCELTFINSGYNTPMDNGNNPNLVKSVQPLNGDSNQQIVTPTPLVTPNPTELPPQVTVTYYMIGWDKHATSDGTKTGYTDVHIEMKIESNYDTQIDLSGVTLTINWNNHNNQWVMNSPVDGGQSLNLASGQSVIANVTYHWNHVNAVVGTFDYQLSGGGSNINYVYAPF